MTALPHHLRIALLAALLVSGCMSSSKQDGGAAAADPGTSLAPGLSVPAANNTTAPALPITLELAGCLQLHTFFPYPVAMFAQLGFQLPEGFAFDSDDGQTVNVFLAWWSCPDAALNNTPNAPFGPVGSMFAAMPVVPPAALTGADANPVAVQLDLLPLTWVIDQQLAADHLGTIEGLRDGYVERGDVPFTQNTLPGASMFSAQATASFGVFSVDCAIQPQPGANEAGRYRMWLAPGGAVTGYLDIVNSAGQTLGSGAADLRFNGDTDAGAPPATGGTSHVVAETAVTLAYVPLAAQA